MTEEVRSIQLSVRGKPSAFDLSHDGGTAVVASPGCMTFFDLDGLGVPRHYIYYEQQTQVRRIRFQKEGLLAALRGGAVSIWDPSHTLKPLQGFIQDNDWITNLEWGTHNAHLIATCCDGGDGKIYDARSPYAPAQTIKVGGVCQKISWSKYDWNYLAVSNEKKVSVFDTRMIGTNNTTMTHEVPEGVIQFAWCAKEQHAMVVGGRDGSLSWLNCLGDPKGEVTASQGGLIDEASLLFATPVGMGAIVCRYEYMGNTQQAQPFLTQTAAPGTEQGSGVASTAPAAVSSKRSHRSESMGGTRSESRKVAVNLIGFPGNKKKRTSDSIESNILQMAQCPDPVVGVRWGHPGRLVPPMHSGQEMLFLSTTSCLHAVAIRADTINKYCSVVVGGLGSTDRYPMGANNAKQHGQREQPLLQLKAPKFCLSGLKRYVTPSDPAGSLVDASPSGRESGRKTDKQAGAGTALSLSGGYWVKLQDSVLLLQKKMQGGYLEGLSIDLVDKYARQITLCLERPDSAPFATTVLTTHSKTPPVTATDKAVYSGNAFSDFAAIAAVEAPGALETVEECPEKPSKQTKKPEDEEGVLLSKIARKNGVQVGAKSSAVISGPTGLSEKEKRLSDRTDRIERSKAKNAALIISFPPNYPQSGYPTFTLRSGGLASSSSSLRSDIIAELASIAKGSTLKVSAGPSGEDGKEQLTPTKLLFDVAECFRSRTLQYWGVKVNVPPTKFIASAPNQMTQLPSQVSLASADSSVFSNSRSPMRARGSGSHGDLGLNIDGSPEPTMQTMMFPEAEGFPGRHSNPVQHSLSITPPPTANKLSVESEQRRRIGGDDMYDGIGIDTEKIGVGEKDGDQGGADGVVAYSKATEVIDPMAYYVPCPASSGGFFAPSGALMTFGGAKFVIRPASKSDGDSVPALTVDTEMHQPEQADTEGVGLAVADEDVLGGSNFVQNMYPKSYADMLLRQREREFYESEKTAEDERGKLGDRAGAVSPSRRSHQGTDSTPRPIVKSSSGVFFVDRNMNSDISGSEDESTEDESMGSQSEESSSDDDSDDDYDLTKNVDISPTTSNMSNSLYTNPLLYAADIDMEAISAHLDEEQLYLKRNPSTGSMSSAVDLSSLPPLAQNGDVVGAEARRKRFLVAEALQVSSQNPTLVEIYSKGFETYQTLADVYDLGPMPAKSENAVAEFLPVLKQASPYRIDHKIPNALFAHLRAEPEGGSRLLTPTMGYNGEGLVRSPSRGISPLSRANPPKGVPIGPAGYRMRTSSSYNDLLMHDVDNLYEEMHSKSVDKESAVPAIRFPADIKEEAEAGSQVYLDQKRNVTWGKEPSSESMAPGRDFSGPPAGGGLEATQFSVIDIRNEKRPMLKSTTSNGWSSIQQLPFNMSDLDIYSVAHKDEGSNDLYDDYQIDDFSFGRGGDISLNSQVQGAVSNSRGHHTSKTQPLQSTASTGDSGVVIDPIIQDYLLSKILSRVESCKYNASVAAAKGNTDASQLWHLLSISLGTMAISVPLRPGDIAVMNNSSRNSCLLLSRGLQTSWHDSAIGLLLLKRVLSLCEQTGGVQTLATIICVLGGPSHVAVLLAGQHPYFSSCSTKSMTVPIQVCPELLTIQVRYNGVLTAYCNALYSWGKFITCTEIAKRIDFLDGTAAEQFLPHIQSHISLSSLLSSDSVKDKDISTDDSAPSRRKKTSTNKMSMELKCPTCFDCPLDDNWCSQCSAFSIRCGVCQEGIRGAAIYCPVCLHGGHIDHMRQWFGQLEQAYCPTGCGCECSSHLKPSDQEIDTSDSDSDNSYSDHSGPSRLLRSSYSESSAVDSDEDSSESSDEEGSPMHRSASTTHHHQRLFQKR